MGDKETDSLWSHILGEGMSGKMKGKKLTILPAIVTTWEAWTQEHPDTTATMLKPTAVQFTTTYLNALEIFSVGMVHESHTRYWKFELLNEHEGPVNDSSGTLDVVVHFDKEHRTATVWERKVGEQTLTFVQQEVLVVDSETNSTWDLTKGLALDGELQGSRLTATTAVPTFTNAWKRFHLDSSVWEPSSP